MAFLSIHTLYLKKNINLMVHQVKMQNNSRAFYCGRYSTQCFIIVHEYLVAGNVNHMRGDVG